MLGKEENASEFIHKVIKVDNLEILYMYLCCTNVRSVLADKLRYRVSDSGAQFAR